MQLQFFLHKEITATEGNPAGKVLGEYSVQETSSQQKLFQPTGYVILVAKKDLFNYVILSPNRFLPVWLSLLSKSRTQVLLLLQRIKTEMF